MQAGRELDALIAEKVMGCALMTQEEMRVEAEAVWAEQPHCIHFLRGFTAIPVLGEWRFEMAVPRYSTEIAAAWLVVEKMRDRGIYIDVDTQSGDYCARAGWEGPPNGDIWEMRSASAEVAPLAICRVALAALTAIGDTDA